MDNTHRHRNYEFRCGAIALTSGKFAPTLSVWRAQWPRRPRELAVERGDHATEESALAAAKQQGLDWVDNFG